MLQASILVQKPSPFVAMDAAPPPAPAGASAWMAPAGLPPLEEFGGSATWGRWKYVVGAYVNVDLGEEYPGSQIALREGASNAGTLPETLAAERRVSYKNGPWHGSWGAGHEPSHLDMSFDYKSRDDYLKTTRFLKEPGLPAYTWSGRDKQGRQVFLTWLKAWRYLNKTDGWEVMWQNPAPPFAGASWHAGASSPSASSPPPALASGSIDGSS